MKKEGKSVNRIVVLNILSTVLVQGVAFFSAPFFSRLMGTSNYGIYSVYSTWVSIIAVLFGLQTNTSVGVAIQDFDRSEHKKYQSSVMSLSILAFVIGSTIVVLFLEPISRLVHLESMLILLVLCQSFCAMTISFMNTVFTMEYKAGKNLILTVSSSIGGIILSFALFFVIPSDINYYARILGCILVDIFISIIVVIQIYRAGRCIYNKEYWKYCIPIAVPMVFQALSGIILNQSDRVIMQNLLDTSSVGIYSLSFTFSSVIASIYMALNNSFVPFYYEFLHNRDIELINKKSKNYMELYAVIVIGFLMLSPEIFSIFASGDYLEGRDYIPLFCLGSFFIFMYSFSVNFEIYMKKSKMVAIATGISAIINIILNIVFIKLMGVMGVVLATVVSDFLLYVIHFLFAIRISNSKKHPVSFKIQFTYIVIITIVSIASMIIGERFEVARWIIAILLGVGEIMRINKRKSIF